VTSVRNDPETLGKVHDVHIPEDFDATRARGPAEAPRRRRAAGFVRGGA
jgi:hypothetical protein